MTNRLEALSRDVIRYIDRMDMQEWLFATIIAIGIGILCLRGFGSRSDY